MMAYGTVWAGKMRGDLPLKRCLDRLVDNVEPLFIGRTVARTDALADGSPMIDAAGPVFPAFAPGCRGRSSRAKLVCPSAAPRREAGLGAWRCVHRS